MPLRDQPSMTNLMVLQCIRYGLHPFSHLGQLLNTVGFVIQLSTDGLELLTGLEKGNPINTFKFQNPPPEYLRYC